MLSKYGGRMEDILYHWWFDDEKAEKLKNAMDLNTPLDIKDESYFLEGYLEFLFSFCK